MGLQLSLGSFMELGIALAGRVARYLRCTVMAIAFDIPDADLIGCCRGTRDFHLTLISGIIPNIVSDKFSLQELDGLLQLPLHPC